MRIALYLAVIGAGLCVSATAFAVDAPEASVKMQQQTFVQAQTDVAVGTRITWTNTDTMPHSVTANDGRFDSGAILPGKTFQWTPTEAGTIGYHCIFHPSMTAVLTVHASAAKGGQ
jgi:plastocyanin